MINLLPPKEKEELLLEGNKKLVIVLGNIVLISLICLTLILFSLKFYILGEVIYQRVILENTEKKYKTPDFLYFREIVQKYNAALVKTDNFYKSQKYFSDVLKIISEFQKSKGLHLTDIAIENTKIYQKAKITVAGLSETRDDLLIFKENIENNEKIENIYFPPSSWVKNTDISFYLTFGTKAPALTK